MLTIKGWRRAREMSQKELADSLGVSMATIHNWENDSSCVPIKHCIKMAEVFNVKLEDIIFLPIN